MPIKYLPSENLPTSKPQCHRNHPLISFLVDFCSKQVNSNQRAWDFLLARPPSTQPVHGRWPALCRRAGTDCRTKDKEVLKEALKPHQEEDAYLGVLYNSAPTTIAAQIIKEATATRLEKTGNSSRGWHKSGYQEYHREVTQTKVKSQSSSQRNHGMATV